MSKYGNKKTVVDGITFDSKKEANRYCQLKMLERAREISQLELQHEFELIPAQMKNGGIRSERACKYRADFSYVTKDGMGRNQFVAEHGIDLQNDMLTVSEFIKLTENSDGGAVIQKLKAEIERSLK